MKKLLASIKKWLSEREGRNILRRLYKQVIKTTTPTCGRVFAALLREYNNASNPRSIDAKQNVWFIPNRRAVVNAANLFWMPKTEKRDDAFDACVGQLERAGYAARSWVKHDGESRRAYALNLNALTYLVFGEKAVDKKAKGAGNEVH